MYRNNRMRNIEIPENLFSNLGEIKTKKPKLNEKPSIIEEYQDSNDIRLTNYTNHEEYRNRITKMYEDLKDIKPIDNEIDNVLYFNNYVEKGIVIRPKISSLKQFWTEYRLINNEKIALKEPPRQLETEEPPKIKETLNSFDELFENLSIRVSEINNYIDELKEMRRSIDETTIQLKEDKEQFNEKIMEFQNYKEQEQTKINEEKETLKINFERLQTIIDDLDKKLGTIDKN